MSIYFVKGKGWRYDFTLNELRHTEAWFKTKSQAKKAEEKRKEEIKNPKPLPETPTDMAFRELVNKRLDHVKAYNSLAHYRDSVSLAKKWVAQWGALKCHEITAVMVQDYVIKRSKVSGYTANKDLRYLRTAFNFGIKHGWINFNPTVRVDYLPVEKKFKYVPSTADVNKVLIAANHDTRDYLYCIRESLARMGEINKLTWADVNFDDRYVVLYTRKKKGSNRTPRKVPMTNKLYEVLSRRFKCRSKDIPWVFWHRYWSRKEQQWVVGPYKERKKFMQTLCKKAGVKYFRFHPLRHYGASMMDSANINIGSIQRILGHENRTTTEVYLHSIGESERKAMEIYEQVSEKSHTESHTKEKALS